LLLEVNFTPTSTLRPAPESTFAGAALLFQMVQGQTGGGGGCTVSETKLLFARPFCVAVIVTFPAACPVAKPELLIVAINGFDEFHTTSELIFCVAPPRYVPVAVNCCVPPAATDGLLGLTEIDVRGGPPLIR
jgi:hypothetical protein